MSLLNRKPVSIGRAERTQRDDRVFLVATEDTYAPEQYFANLGLARVKVMILPTPQGSGLSAPEHVVARLKEAFQRVREDVQVGDEFWVFLDTDHYFGPGHRAGTLQAMQTARQAGFEVAVSNPCFELWLLLHHEEVAPATKFANCGEVEARLRAVLGDYDKTSLKAGRFPLPLVSQAVARAHSLDGTPDALWPAATGTRIYRLLERVLGL
jgi:hypothetical protein